MAMIDTEDLVANIDIAEMLGVGAPAVNNWVQRHRNFPKPVVRVSRGAVPLYDRDQVVEWAATTGRLPTKER